MVSLYQDPTGNKIFSEMNPSKQSEQTQSTDHHNMAVGMSGLTDTEKISLLTSRVTHLEEKIRDRNGKMAEQGKN